jgi:hypothetical protein
MIARAHRCSRIGLFKVWEYPSIRCGVMPRFFVLPSLLGIDCTKRGDPFIAT